MQYTICVPETAVAPSSSTLNIKGKKRVLIHIEGKTSTQLESNFQFESEVGST
jgi:hypothetical protein